MFKFFTGLLIFFSVIFLTGADKPEYFSCQNIDYAFVYHMDKQSFKVTNIYHDAKQRGFWRIASRYNLHHKITTYVYQYIVNTENTQLIKYIESLENSVFISTCSFEKEKYHVYTNIRHKKDDLGEGDGSKRE